ncbi:TetR family transcriptional regulator [Paucibacter sp. KBW04]|uniref:TetR/AcrR family transcriptional regulator n=1 Tax=Paucibacter sp. KBW04 TaxID=2153361 RepID=UPI000F579648|nr:TetR/AcrR family transcriptional regulator [Paucibacter sp. KBW04]RQO55378.1 TetR family transcriptional regulator [Paucibacter sp. KBW04]
MSPSSSPPPPADSSPRPRQRRKEARPQELLEAALALFVERGFAATRSEEVALRAGVSKGTLYRYYPSKEELFKAVVRENLTAHIAETAAFVANFEGPSDLLLRQVMEAWCVELGRGGMGGIVKIMLSEARNFPELANFYRDEVIVPTDAVLGALLQRGISLGEFRPVPVPEMITILIGPLLHLIIHEHSLGSCGLPCMEVHAADVLAVQLDLVLRGLMLQPPPG